MDLPTVTGYRRPATRADLDLQPGEALLAGGSWLFSTPQPTTTGLVDLTSLGWPAWERTESGLRVAATCTVAQLRSLPADVLGAAGGLVRSCADALLMSFKVQSVATVGGNLCLGLPAGAMIALASALDGEVVVWTPGGGERREPVTSFVRGPGRTTLTAGEVLRAVELPTGALTSRTAARRIGLAPQGRSSALVLGRLDGDGSVVVTVTAATERPVGLRFPAVPSGGELAAALEDVRCWYDDPHGSPDWRCAVTGTLAAAVLAELVAA